METYEISLEFIYRLARSYPTYEEWKHRQHAELSNEGMGSYPTYEEWKLATNSKGKYLPLCSYPTYEEWKHDNFNIII